MQFLCTSDDLPDSQSRGFDINGLNLVAVRREGSVFVYQNRCPHRGVPLEWRKDEFLDASGSLIQCATHGALFLIESGECVAGPCAGSSLNGFACHEDASGIWVDLPAAD